MFEYHTLIFVLLCYTVATVMTDAGKYLFCAPDDLELMLEAEQVNK